MNRMLLFAVATLAGLSVASTASAPIYLHSHSAVRAHRCVHGVPCGNICIAKGKVCHTAAARKHNPF